MADNKVDVPQAGVPTTNADSVNVDAVQAHGAMTKRKLGPNNQARLRQAAISGVIRKMQRRRLDAETKISEP